MTLGFPLVSTRHHRLGVVSGRALYDAGVWREEVPGAALLLLCWLRAACRGSPAHAATAPLAALGVPHFWHASWEFLELEFECLDEDVQAVVERLPVGTRFGSQSDPTSLRDAVDRAFRMHHTQMRSALASGASHAAQALGRACLDRYGLVGAAPPAGADGSVIVGMWERLGPPKAIVLAGDTDVAEARPVWPSAAAPIPRPPRPVAAPVCRDERVCVTVALEAVDWPIAATTAMVLERELVGRFRQQDGLAYEISSEPLGHCVLGQMVGGRKRRDALVVQARAVLRHLRELSSPLWQQGARMALAQALAVRQRSEVVVDRMVEIMASQNSFPGQEMEREIDRLRWMAENPADLWRPAPAPGVLVLTQPGRPAQQHLARA